MPLRRELKERSRIYPLSSVILLIKFCKWLILKSETNKQTNKNYLQINKQTKIHLSSIPLKPLQHYLCTLCQGADLHRIRPFDAFVIIHLILKMLKQTSNFTPVNSIYSSFMVRHLAISSILEVLSLDIWREGWETQQVEMFLTCLYLSFSHHFFW